MIYRAIIIAISLPVLVKDTYLCTTFRNCSLFLFKYCTIDFIFNISLNSTGIPDFLFNISLNFTGIPRWGNSSEGRGGSLSICFRKVPEGGLRTAWIQHEQVGRRQWQVRGIIIIINESKIRFSYQDVSRSPRIELNYAEMASSFHLYISRAWVELESSCELPIHNPHP